MHLVSKKRICTIHLLILKKKRGTRYESLALCCLVKRTHVSSQCKITISNELHYHMCLMRATSIITHNTRAFVKKLIWVDIFCN